jgi:hypothetical protein
MKLTPTTVILSGASNSQSELLAESKDPTNVPGKTGITRNSLGIISAPIPNARGEPLATSSKHLIIKGAFDYVSPSLRSGAYFAQDDSEIE